MIFYNEEQAIDAASCEPRLIFDLIKEGHKGVVDKILSKNLISINTKDEFKNDVITRLLKKSWYDLVLKYMKKKDWQINNQNIDGDTFGHILVTKKYLDIINILKALLKNKEFKPNLLNKNGESILDKSLQNDSLYTTTKILEDKRFNTINLISFKNLYEKCIKTNKYGAYTKLTNLEIIVDSLTEKKLMPKMRQLIKKINKNIDDIKAEVKNNQLSILDNIINTSILNAL